MIRTRIVRLVLFCGLLSSAIVLGTVSTEEFTASEGRIEDLLRQMTLEEKVGQLTLLTSDLDETGPSIREQYREDIRAGRVGAVFNAFGAEFTRSLQRLAVEETRLGIPLLFGYDVVHGHRTIFPVPLAQAASWDIEAVRRAARVSAIEASAEGLHWTFAPMVDIARDPRWGRIVEGPGEDPFLGQLMAMAQVQGYQGSDLTALDTILACAKHFAAYGAAEAGRDYNTVDMSERRLREVYLPPFQAAVDAGAASIMTGFNDLNGVPVTASAFLLTTILRNEWQFPGFVVSDYTSINELVPHGFARDEAHAARLALAAGVDMDMQGSVFMQHLPEAVRNGEIAEKLIDDAVLRILRAKESLGLFEDPYRYSDSDREQSGVLTREHRQAARDMARRSIVLLKNEDGLLPLSFDFQTVAVVGPLADSREDMLGSWSAAGSPDHVITLLKALQARFGSRTEFLHSPGAAWEEGSPELIEEAVGLAQQAEVVIAAVGEPAWMSGEAASRASLDLPGSQQQLIERLVGSGKPVVVVLMSGRPLVIPWIDRNAPAILQAWFPGIEAGEAIVDVLAGEYNPSGRLPVTFPRALGQVPIYYAYKSTGRPSTENKYTSKYLDVSNEPLYPFGFGLGYSAFEYSDLTLSAAVLRTNESLKVSATIRNSGTRTGEEVVQFYVRKPVASVTRPVRELKGFEKISLHAGESKTVIFQIRPADLAFYDQEMRFAPEPGEFEVYVGPNSAEGLQGQFRLEN